MMRAMRTGTIVVAGACLLGAMACGGGEKGANSPGACPDGTVLKGSDCVPADTANDEPAPKHSSAPKNEDGDSTTSAGDSAPTGTGKSYDKDAVDAEMKRAARQVKSACGSATDDDGKATGPWGKATATITLGRNGHVKQVTLPGAYDGKPAGTCVVHAFQKIQFPPYAAPSDATIEWDVVLVEPKH
jgi:hypothetical protein